MSNFVIATRNCNAALASLLVVLYTHTGQTVPASPHLKCLLCKGQYRRVGSLHLYLYEMQILCLHMGNYIILFLRV